MKIKLIKNLLLFRRLAKKIGFKNAYIYKKNINKNTVFRIKINNIEYSMRGKTTDFSVFKSIILNEEYSYNYPESCKYIIDAGANIGISSIYFAQKFPNAKIIAIEPEKSNYNLLVINTKPFKNIIPINAAIWPEDSYVKIKNCNSEKYAFQVIKLNFGEKDCVKAISPQSIMSKYGWDSIDIFKIDIEGSEKELFLHYNELWILNTKIFIVELHEFFAPGCSKIFYNAIRNNNFIQYIKGENIFIENV